MGTSFAVVYANNHLIFEDTNIVYSFNIRFNFYFCFIDDEICLWHGSDEDFLIFSQEFNNIDPTIKFIWSKLSFSAVFLYLQIEISAGCIHYEVYSKPGNAYAYLRQGSFHVRGSFPTWIRGLLITALTHSSDFSRWKKRCQLLYTKLRQRGYNAKFLMTEFAKVSWDDRSRAIAPKIKNSTPFDKRCVWSCENAVGLRELFLASILNLSEIDADVFPARINTVIKGAKRLSTYLQ